MKNEFNLILDGDETTLMIYALRKKAFGKENRKLKNKIQRLQSKIARWYNLISKFMPNSDEE